MAQAPQADWVAIEGIYRAGVKSIRDIAIDHGISDTAVRKHAKKHGWLRDPEGTKRQMVRAALSGFSVDGSQFAVKTLGEETSQDIRDMEGGLAVARLCIERLQLVVVDSKDPREIKVIADANKVAIETIRKIRGLDDPQRSDDDLPLVIVRNFSGTKPGDQDGK